ncbi:levanbiose-producing levanase [Spiroplasma gladiatoris]|uniref:Levanbiose-producing levanase n=1 Tax=Spiroplasma gladiatoris TaxID=2143 RepID=A0A4P7AJQ1_9MOLU|nr:glycoside hydrolase family 32 protein [Spiroplasma gladiatoris]QBQ07973.1 levanbiose-producing levanase [Spiroplasma gladiatoris]
MKKLLNILGVLTICSSSAMMLVSCENTPKQKDDNQTENDNKKLDEYNFFDKSLYQPKDEQNKFLNNFHVDAPDKKGMLNDMQGAFFDGTYWHLYFLYNKDAEYNSNGEQIGKNGTEWYHVQTKDFNTYEYKSLAVKKWNDWGDAAGGTLYLDVDGDFNPDKIKNGRVAISTAYGGEKGQNIMAYYSSPGNENGVGNDFGYNFELLNNGKPILENGKAEGTYPDFRDPHFFKKDNKFIMYVSELDRFGVYVSDNPLGEYKKTGEYLAKHAMVECANLFELKVNGDQKNKKYVMIYGGNGNNTNENPELVDNLGTGTYYAVGHLDSNFVFVEDQPAKRLDFGADFYAAKFFNDYKNGDLNDHLIGTGWMSSWDYNRVVPNTGYWGNMSLAREIRLTQNQNGEYGFEQKFLGQDSWKKTKSGNNSDLISNKLAGGSYKLDLNFKNVTDSDKYILSFSDKKYKTKIEIDLKKNKITSLRSSNYDTLKQNNGFIQERSYNTNFDLTKDFKISLNVDTTTIEVIMPDGSAISLLKFIDGNSFEQLKLLSTNNNFTFDYYQK